MKKLSDYTNDELAEGLRLLRNMARAQETFWDAAGELERFFDVEINTLSDWTGYADADDTKSLEDLAALSDSDDL